MSVILIAGPPCSGKTTYVQDHAQPGDIVLDQDELGGRRMRWALRGLPSHRTAWVIRCAPGKQAREILAARLHASSVVLLLPALEVLIHRAQGRDNTAGTIKAIREWLRVEQHQPSLSVDPATI